MIKKFVTNFSRDEIEVIDVIRETKKCVFLKPYSSLQKGEIRDQKISDGRCYFDSFEDAKNHLILLANERLDRLEKSLKYERAKRDRIENINCS